MSYDLDTTTAGTDRLGPRHSRHCWTFASQATMARRSPPLDLPFLPPQFDDSWRTSLPIDLFINPAVFVPLGPTAADRFEDLVASWLPGSEWQSNPDVVAVSEEYQRMISLGRPILPLILRNLREDGSPHWFWALRTIAQEDPSEDAASIPDAVERWLRWGHERGLLG